ncbi:uncharacterized protein LOC133175059 isoform X1 [Saccostrea echinata]|uniref:uncharacterized protein LOC133175059 isoform X1 n=1 Tax=Saccostrea echinata TaxID=191078 RepID=UPI002A7FEB43|nr:uncharacterized protein LOC133175059 isoform X1 [Saccostrea echinata]
MFVSALILWTALSYGALASLDRCPSVFNRVGGYKTENGEMCYTFVNTEKTWVDANSQCWAWGGELISIKNWNKMSFVIHTLNSVLRWRNNGVWIGAHDRHGRGWQWTNGERLTWGYWASGQPSKTGGFISLEDCALMRRGDGWRWHDYHCDSSFFFTYKFICQFRKLPPTTTTSTSTSTTTSTTTTTIPSTTTTSTTSTSTTIVSPTTSVSMSKTVEDKSNLTVQAVDLGVKFDHTNIKFEKNGIIADKLNQGEGSVSSVVGGESESDSTGSDTGILAGIIVGGAILILIGAIGTLLLRRRRQKKFEEPSVQFQNLAYSRVSNSGQDGNVASNVYMDTNEMNRLYEEVNKQVNHGVNCFSGTVLDIQVPRSDSGDHQENACCGGMSEESDLKKLNNLTHVAIPPDTKNPPDTTENHYVDMSTANKAKETNRLVEASRVVDPSKPSNLGVDREPMPLPVYANSLENLREGTLELTSTLSSQSKESTYMNRQEGFEVDEDGYMSPRSTLHSDSDTELMGADKDPLYDEIR